MTEQFLRFLDTRRGFFWGVGVVSIVSALLRLVRLPFPPSRVFDEVYSPAFAWKFLHGESFFDVHPMLAELPHTLGLSLFGDTPLGWRFAPWVWGILFCWAAAYTSFLLTNRRLAGVVTAVLVSLDTAFFIYGRTGLPDMFLLSQLALTLTFFFGSIRVASSKASLLLALLSGIAMGNVVSTKWLALAVLVPVWLWLFLHIRQPHLRPRLAVWDYPIAFLVVPFCVYAGWALVLKGAPFSSVSNPQAWVETSWASIVEWHGQVFTYHAHLTATHPYASHWWQWPLLMHPVLFFYEQTDAGRRVINATGNVVVWWAGFAALVGGGLYSLMSLGGLWGRDRSNPVSSETSNEIASSFTNGELLAKTTIVWCVFSALAFWLPWAFITRVSFNYHFFSSFFFEVLLLSLLLTAMLDLPKWRSWAIGFFLAALLGFLVLYPSATALFVPTSITNIFPFIR